MNSHELCKKKAKELVAQMTLEEKASQLTYNSPAIKRLGIPAYNWWNEALHGVARAGTATSFPQAIGLAAIFDEEFLREVADTIAEEGRAKYNESSKHEDRDIYKGLTFWSPNVNIFRDPRWGRGHETYGEDPFLSARLGVAFIKGLQGEGEVLKAAACAKHFAVHSGPEDLRHEFNAEVSLKDLWETYLPAFEACVKEGKVESVMGAYNRTNGEPCCGSYFLLRDILRNKWGFDGHVVSDCWAIKDFHMHHMVTSTPQESAALAIDAGCDLNCGNTYLLLLQALQEGLITEEHITRAAERLFTTRFKLGLFEGSEYDQIPYEVVECKEHIELAIEAARKSAVLLKNDGILPIDKTKVKTIGVIGPNANSRRALKGNYYGTSSRYITVLEGIQDEAGDEVRILYSKGCELVKDRTEPLAYSHDRLMEAVTVAEHSDIVVLCLGLDETIEGEEMDEGNNVGSGDKKDLELPQVQRKLLEKIVAVGKPTILCLLAGSAINLSYAQEHCNGILMAWYPGARGGKAIADILFGKTSPSGKLPITFYASLDNLPPFTDYSMKNRTYRYIEEKPLYPFGYGLTYGDVICTGAVLEEPIKLNQDIKIKVSVKNRGKVATEDVVQVYIKDEESRYAVRNTSLCGFKRIHLNAGEEKEFHMMIPFESLKVVNDEGERILDSNKFTLYIGVSGADERSVELTKKEPVILPLILNCAK
ncbi:MAG: beta-glucosidase [Epulopiscium sp.]|uniref:glycoside hydrolase family 3 C-terminal domain-containing protein n=1 Tax=Defluviitalea raffinosedens TaxID=1450156 RepID=UPI0017690306|nr:glycoside hydrolase family 3 C-terminal domain-containing protein [Defluviitalea raffinosedens]MBM7684314.1 beta-glucosidase [Defluviitalea raffinosedens]MDK2787912.1 beta-glucosidase [Candidatus Epulonipiscium sp.]HHW67590.1 glycoside hydrolase family 3 protein [Candidatus Epulonipiscium sp.]